jgi:hypothetical protein
MFDIQPYLTLHIYSDKIRRASNKIHNTFVSLPTAIQFLKNQKDVPFLYYHTLRVYAFHRCCKYYLFLLTSLFIKQIINEHIYIYVCICIDVSVFIDQYIRF